jgi:hypothetical protein
VVSLKEEAMKIAYLLLGAVLLTGPVAAQSGGAAAGSCKQARSLSPLWNREAVESRENLADHVLFLRLGELAGGLDSGHALALEFDRGGKPIVTEQFLLPQDASGDLEILARHPALLERIYKLAADKDSRLTLKILVDGRIVRELSFQDLTAESRRLQEDELKPVLLKSKVVDRLAPAPSRPRSSSQEGPLLTKGYSPDPACVQDCYDQYAGCSNENLCNSCPTCEELQSQCISWCPQICTDPASVSDRTERELVGLQVVGYGCYEDRWEWDFEHGHYYTTYYYTFKYTTYRRTRYCDGSYSDEVINVTYYSDYCSSPEWTCSWPASWPPAGSCP